MLNLQALAELYHRHSEAASAQVTEFSIQGRVFAFNTRPALMGVINLSTDSWYRESVVVTVDAAVRRAQVLSAQGAEIIDVGAESSLAHAALLDSAAQNSKLLPVIKELRAAQILTSAETYHPDVARAALEAGAGVLNLTGVPTNADIYTIVAAHEAAVIICYVQGENVRAVGDFDFGADITAAMHEYFARQIEAATKAGVARIIIDPGLGFYYRNLQDSSIRVRHQMQTFLSTFRLRTLGYPVCHALPHAFEYFGEDVRCAEPFFAVLAALGKTDLFRTHEVSRTKAVLDTLSQF